MSNADVKLKPSDVFETMPYTLQVLFCSECLNQTVNLLKEKCSKEAVVSALKEALREELK